MVDMEGIRDIAVSVPASSLSTEVGVHSFNRMQKDFICKKSECLTP